MIHARNIHAALVSVVYYGRLSTRGVLAEGWGVNIVEGWGSFWFGGPPRLGSLGGKDIIRIYFRIPKISRIPRKGFEPTISHLPALRAQPLSRWWHNITLYKYILIVLHIILNIYLIYRENLRNQLN